jgi:hypothetical protein
MYGFKFSESLQRAREIPLFKGYHFYFLSPFSSSPSIKDLSLIIKEAGGKILRSFPTKVAQNTFLVACKQPNEHEDTLYGDYKQAEHRKDKFFVQDIITAVLIQKLPKI